MYSAARPCHRPLAAILLVAATLLIVAPRPRPQHFEPVSAAVALAIVAGKVVTATVAEKLLGAVVADTLLHSVFNNSRACYEEFVCGKQCNAGFVAVEAGTRGYDVCWKRCCPQEPVSCYESDKCWTECAPGYAAVESWGCGDTCCPVATENLCFKSSKCFAECPDAFAAVESGSIPGWDSCDDMCCTPGTCFVSGKCGADCPVGFLNIKVDQSNMTDSQLLALHLSNPFGCTDVCCPTGLIQSEAASAELGSATAAKRSSQPFEETAAETAAGVASFAAAGVVGAVTSSLIAGVDLSEEVTALVKGGSVLAAIG